MMVAITTIWLLLALATVAVLNIIKHIVAALHEADIEGCPNPDLCPGCDGQLEFDDDGSNICPLCGMTWWRR